MARTRDRNGRALVVAVALGIASVPVGTIVGGPLTASAQEGIELTTTSSVQSGQTGVGATRGIARPGSVTTQAPATVAPPSTIATATSTTQGAAVVTTVVSTSTQSVLDSPAAPDVSADNSNTPAWTVETPDSSVEGSDGALTGGTASTQNDAVGGSLIPSAPPTAGAAVPTDGAIGGADSGVASPPADEPDPSVESGGVGWFSGAAVTDGGLVSTAETTAPPVATTAPAATTTAVDPTPPTTGASTPATNPAEAPTRDVGRSRTSGLFEVGAVIAGVIGLSAVPVFLARLIRTRREDEPVRDQVPA